MNFNRFNQFTCTSLYFEGEVLYFSYKGMDGEPDAPEYRVQAKGNNREVILRVESQRNVVVYSLVFIRTSVLESLENEEINFTEVAKVFRK